MEKFHHPPNIVAGPDPQQITTVGLGMKSLKRAFVFPYCIICFLIMGCQPGGTGKAEEDSSPTVSDGALKKGTVSTNQITLSWAAASDDQTETEDLTYSVYYSTSEYTGTVSEIEKNGTVFSKSTANLTGTTVTGLSSNTTYFINVIVSDASGKKTAYDGMSVTTGKKAKTLHDTYRSYCWSGQYKCD